MRLDEDFYGFVICEAPVVLGLLVAIGIRRLGGPAARRGDAAYIVLGLTLCWGILSLGIFAVETAQRLRLFGYLGLTWAVWGRDQEPPPDVTHQ